MSIGKRWISLLSVWFTAVILIRETTGAVKRPIKIPRGLSSLYTYDFPHPQKTTLNVRRVQDGWSYVLSLGKPTCPLSITNQLLPLLPSSCSRYRHIIQAYQHNTALWVILLTGGQVRSRVIWRPLWDLCWSYWLWGICRLGASNRHLFTLQKSFRKWGQTELETLETTMCEISPPLDVSQ